MSVPFFTSRCCSLISLAVVVTLRDYLAGVSGAICADVVIAPVTGAFVFSVSIVTGQLPGPMLAEHFGASGFAVREASPACIAGLLPVFFGAILMGRG